MTDEGSAPPPADSAPTPPPAEPTPTPPAPTPSPEPPAVSEVPPAPPVETPSATDPAPVISQEAIAEVSQELTEVVKDAILQDPKHESQPETTHASSPAASSSPPAPPGKPKKSTNNRMLTVVRARKAERLEKIVALAREKGSITNDDVELLVKKSDSTVTRDLNTLVIAARLRRVGHRKHERYEPL